MFLFSRLCTIIEKIAHNLYADIYALQTCKKEKKDLKRVLTYVLAVVILAGAFAGYWFNRPVAKASRAIEKNEFEKVAGYYNKCKKDEDRDTITEQLRLYCQDLSVSYTNEELEYEFVKGQYDVIDEVMSDNEVFQNLVEAVDLLHTSRESYKAGMAAFEAKDYETAIAEFENVLMGNENYDEVQEMIKVCKKELLPDFLGVWENKIDIGPILSAYLGSRTESISFELISYYEFFEDGTGKKSTDENQARESFDSYIDLMIDMLAKQSGVSRKQLDARSKQVYGMDMKSYVMKNADIDKSIEELGMTELNFTYTVDGEDIIVKDSDPNNKRDYKFTIKDDELLLQADINSSETDMLKNLGIEYPLHFTRVK